MAAVVLHQNATVQMKYCAEVLQTEQLEVHFLHVIFKHLPCQIKGLGRWLNSGLRLYLKENVTEAAHQLQGKHILEEQLITCHPRTQCRWGNLNQKNSIYRVQTVFFLHVSAASNTVLCSTREKLTQSTFIRLIYITGPSHAYILLFSVITIMLPDLLKLLTNQKPTRTIHLQLKNIVSRKFLYIFCEEETLPAALLPLRGRHAKRWQENE